MFDSLGAVVGHERLRNQPSTAWLALAHLHEAVGSVDTAHSLLKAAVRDTALAIIVTISSHRIP